MENADAIATLISNVGFPVVATMALAYGGYKLFVHVFDKTISKISEELKTVKEVVENNNRLVEKLLDRLDVFWGNIERSMKNDDKD